MDTEDIGRKGDRSVRGKEEDMQKKAAGSGRISMMFCLLPAVLCFILMFQICALGEPISDQPSLLPEYIHYENLEELIKSHSPQVQMERFSYEKRLGMYENAWEEMKETRRLLREEAESLEDEGDEEGAAQYREQAEVLEDAAEEMEEQIRHAKGNSATMSLRQMEDTVLWNAQSLMASYHTLKAERENALAQYRWSDSLSETKNRQADLGVIPVLEAREAEKKAGDAASRVSETENEMERIKKELMLLIGYDPGQQIEIYPLPQTDPGRVENMGREQDQLKALWNNYELRAQRSGGASSNRELHARQRAIYQSEEEMYAKLSGLYEEVLAKKSQWEHAAAAMSRAGAAFSEACNRQSLGLLSQSGYLESEALYKKQEADMARAQAAFLQAMDAYDWALKGLMM